MDQDQPRTLGISPIMHLLEIAKQLTGKSTPEVTQENDCQDLLL